MASSVHRFHPLIASWFTERIGTPTDVQERAWSLADTEHMLMTAPTGSGKTLAAFLSAVNSLITKPREGAYRILYISPLKALNNDIRRNLEAPIEALRGYFTRSGETFPDISIGVRSGDTSAEERRRMQRHPPDIFITTPESLAILLTAASGEPLISNIGTVILDEIHAVAGTKRGVFLMSAIERLTEINGEFRRIAVSATVNPLPRIAELVGGYKYERMHGEAIYQKRSVTIVRSEIEKKYDISVSFPELGEETSRDDWWLATAKTFRGIIGRNRSTLLFANSRRMVEKITRFLNESTDAPDVYSHHGSLSREIRAVVEERFKKGELAAVVATSSLELGIDIGDVGEVILVEPPFSVSAALQRIGRAGHAVGSVSRSTFYALHAHDLISAAVLAAHASSDHIEEIIPPTAPLDVLAQVILSMTVGRTRDITEVFDAVRASWYYHELTRTEFDLVIAMLAGRYADSRIRELSPRIVLDKTAGTIRARDGAAMLIYLSGGVIADRGYYTMRDAGTKAVIGELDEEFVWERSLGDVFPFGNRLWRIIRITHNDVDVNPVGDKASALPFWKADSVSRPYAFSEKIGAFLEDAEAHLDDDGFHASLRSTYRMNDHAAESLIAYLKLQRGKTDAPLPHRHHLLIEHSSDPNNKCDAKQTILHTLWGLAVNRPFAFALAAAWEKKHGYPLVFFASNDAIMLELPHEFSAADVLSLVTPENASALIREKLESHEFFGGHFRENAQRALLLPRNFKKRMPLWLNRLRSKKLLEATAKYDDFPVIIETWRSCLRDESDLPALASVLGELADGRIRVTETVTTAPSPFASDVAWRQTNTYMYADDTPLSAFKSGIRGDLIKNIFSTGAFPVLSDDLLARFDAKRKRIAPGYAPDSLDELFLFVKDRRFIPPAEWTVLLAAMHRDHGIMLTPEDIAGRFIIENGVIAREDEGTMAAVLGSAAPDESDAAEIRTQFVSEFLLYYTPMSEAALAAILPLPPELLSAALHALIENGSIIVGQFRGPESDTELCEAGTLETLLRMRRTDERPRVEAKPITALSAFLARRQGLTAPGTATADLQRCMERLFGYSAKAAFWEAEILPARLSPYYTAWLDTVLAGSDLLWFGTGDERISFCFSSDHELFASAAAPKNALSDFFTGKNGRYTLADIMKETALDSSTASASLWELAFRGCITNDDFRSVRLGIQNGFSAEDRASTAAAPARSGFSANRRSGFNRWKTSRPFAGAWYALPLSMDRDPIEEQELIKDRARMVLGRYGIVFRELLAHEIPALRWKELFTAFRLMELSGEIVSGQFFSDVLGLQFAAPDAIADFSADMGDTVWWINAADPASAAGIDIPSLKSQLPERLQSTHIVFRGESIVLVSRKNGKDITITVGADDERITDYCGVFRTMVSREFQPISAVRIETINGAGAVGSEYRAAFANAGFQSDGRSLVLMKKY